MKILVTGTAGFIGYHLAKRLLERGDEVVGVDNVNEYYDVNLKYARLKELGIAREESVDKRKSVSKIYEKHSFYKIDISDKEAVEALLKKRNSMQDGDVVSTYADVSGLIDDFGYKPKTDLKDGIAQFIKWYKEYYGDNDEL